MDSTTKRPGRLQRWAIRIGITCLVLLVLYASLRYSLHRYVQWEYPYGWSHCCDSGLHMLLLDYARTHDGYFPAGEATPEASLSLLYREGLADPNLLRGKTVPEEIGRKILERGDLLGPDTCGWHYVEGFHMDDDPRLALLWDKVGLDHNGGRLSRGGYYAKFVGGWGEHIPQAKWNAFLKEQQLLLAQRNKVKRPPADARAEFDGQKVHVQLRVENGCVVGRVWHYGGKKNGYSSEELMISPGGRNSPLETRFRATEKDLASALVNVDAEKKQIRFMLPKHKVIFEDGHFEVRPLASETR